MKHKIPLGRHWYYSMTTYYPVATTYPAATTYPDLYIVLDDALLQILCKVSSADIYAFSLTCKSPFPECFWPTFLSSFYPEYTCATTSRTHRQLYTYYVTSPFVFIPREICNGEVPFQICGKADCAGGTVVAISMEGRFKLLTNNTHVVVDNNVVFINVQCSIGTGNICSLTSADTSTTGIYYIATRAIVDVPTTNVPGMTSRMLSICVKEGSTNLIGAFIGVGDYTIVVSVVEYHTHLIVLRASGELYAVAKAGVAALIMSGVTSVFHKGVSLYAACGRGTIQVKESKGWISVTPASPKVGRTPSNNFAKMVACSTKKPVFSLSSTLVYVADERSTHLYNRKSITAGGIHATGIIDGRMVALYPEGVVLYSLYGKMAQVRVEEEVPEMPEQVPEEMPEEEQVPEVHVEEMPEEVHVEEQVPEEVPEEEMPEEMPEEEA